MLDAFARLELRLDFGGSGSYSEGKRVSIVAQVAERGSMGMDAMLR